VARLSFRDRFFTPPVAKAMMSPGGIVLAGAGLSVGIVAGLPIALAAGIGALAWAGRVAFAVPRNATGERIDPFTLRDPWRQFVREALQAKARFDQAVGSARGGPLRDRLREIGDRIQTGVDECWRTARRGQSLSDARRQIDVADITYQLQQVSGDAHQPWAAGSPLAQTATALQAQLETAERMDRVVTEAVNRLRLLDAKLDEAVTRSIELSVQAENVDELGGLGLDIDNVVTEMEALRQALDETHASPTASLPEMPAPVETPTAVATSPPAPPTAPTPPSPPTTPTPPPTTPTPPPEPPTPPEPPPPDDDTPDPGTP
jgi:hypothetical protein